MLEMGKSHDYHITSDKDSKKVLLRWTQPDCVFMELGEGEGRASGKRKRLQGRMSEETSEGSEGLAAFFLPPARERP